LKNTKRVRRPDKGVRKGGFETCRKEKKKQKKKKGTPEKTSSKNDAVKLKIVLKSTGLKAKEWGGRVRGRKKTTAWSHLGKNLKKESGELQNAKCERTGVYKGLNLTRKLWGGDQGILRKPKKPDPPSKKKKKRPQIDHGSSWEI